MSRGAERRRGEFTHLRIWAIGEPRGFARSAPSRFLDACALQLRTVRMSVRKGSQRTLNRGEHLSRQYRNHDAAEQRAENPIVRTGSEVPEPACPEAGAPILSFLARRDKSIVRCASRLTINRAFVNRADNRSIVESRSPGGPRLRPIRLAQTHGVVRC